MISIDFIREFVFYIGPLTNVNANHWSYTRYEWGTSDTVGKRNTKVCFLALRLTPMHTHTNLLFLPLSSPTHIETAGVFVFKSIVQYDKTTQCHKSVTSDTAAG